jgi:hypothetical protein
MFLKQRFQAYADNFVIIYKEYTLTSQLSSFQIQLIIIQILIEETLLDKENPAVHPGEYSREDPFNTGSNFNFMDGGNDG